GRPRRGRHTRRRGLLARLLPVRRTTFVIDTDRTILKVVANEVRASVHADQTLWYLANRHVPQSSSHVRHKHADVHQAEGNGEPTGDWFTEPQTADEPSLVRTFTLSAAPPDPGPQLALLAAVEELTTS